MAEKGNALAQGALGQSYLRGLGVKQDFWEAKRWFEKASAQGDPESSYTLGMMYERGQGITRDHVRGAQMLQRAAEQGHKKAPTILGMKYHLGVGVPKDNVSAHAWLNIGAALGDEDSKRFRDEVENTMAPTELRDAQRMAREWFAQHGGKDD